MCTGARLVCVPSLTSVLHPFSLTCFVSVAHPDHEIAHFYRELADEYPWLKDFVLLSHILRNALVVYDPIRKYLSVAKRRFIKRGQMQADAIDYLSVLVWEGWYNVFELGLTDRDEFGDEPWGKRLATPGVFYHGWADTLTLLGYGTTAHGLRALSACDITEERYADLLEEEEEEVSDQEDGEGEQDV